MNNDRPTTYTVDPPQLRAEVKLIYDAQMDAWSWSVTLFDCPNDVSSFEHSGDYGFERSKAAARQRATERAKSMLRVAQRRILHKNEQFTVTLDDVE